jgi:hypothetical protein
MIRIINPNEIPKEGKVVLFVTFETAPCKKFINTANQSISIIEKNKVEASYYQITNNNEVKEALRINSMPTCIVYVDGEEKKRFSGHFYSQFEIANMISNGFNS